MLKRLFWALCIVGMMLPAALTTHAQVVGDNITVTITPANPGPNEPVDITLTSYSTNLASSSITWTVDGKTVLAGIGNDHYSFAAKSLGTTTNISIGITAADGTTTTKSVSITPATVDLLWEATDSTVPPLYRGKAMPTSESTVRFVAIPQVRSSAGSIFAPATFLYAWKENFNGVGSASGYGKDSFITTMDYLNETKNVSIDISARDGTPVANAEMALNPSDPKILWYASNPLSGPLFGRALTNNYPVNGIDTSILAEPYFFSPGNPSARILKYEWQINGEPVTTPSTPNLIFLQKDTGSAGTARLDLSLTNLGKLFQDTTSSLTLSVQ